MPKDFPEGISYIAYDGVRVGPHYRVVAVRPSVSVQDVFDVECERV